MRALMRVLMVEFCPFGRQESGARFTTVGDSRQGGWYETMRTSVQMRGWEGGGEVTTTTQGLSVPQTKGLRSILGFRFWQELGKKKDLDETSTHGHTARATVCRPARSVP